MTDEIYAKALDYHRFPRPGKISVTPTKSLSHKRDLSLAYTPGVAAPCEEIVKSPLTASHYTCRGNLVAVITNGSAVLGLGNIGPLAAKPVMEGKAVLFKKFAGLDVFDIEIQEADPLKLIDIVASLEPTFGGINLEDIKAPECFMIEKTLQDRLNIPVFHDDQHGTAIVVAAAVLNSLRLVNKRIEDVKLVTSGAGAAAIACLELLIKLGLNPQNAALTDLEGVVYKGRPGLMDTLKLRHAADTSARTLGDATFGADIFLGLSAGRVLKEDMIVNMAANPIIFALANPTPEILPDLAKAVRPDAILATGRTDYPNQINNVLCFPFIFRGALDTEASEINDAMKLACVHALASLAHSPVPRIVHEAYPDESLIFGPDYIIPKPFDPRLLAHLAPPVAKAAMDTGVARRHIPDFAAYVRELHRLVSPEHAAFYPIKPFPQPPTTANVATFGETTAAGHLRATRHELGEGSLTITTLEDDQELAQALEEDHLNLIGLSLDTAEQQKTLDQLKINLAQAVMIGKHQGNPLLSIVENSDATPENAGSESIRGNNDTLAQAIALIKTLGQTPRIGFAEGAQRQHLPANVARNFSDHSDIQASPCNVLIYGSDKERESASRLLQTATDYRTVAHVLHNGTLRCTLFSNEVTAIEMFDIVSLVERAF